MKMVVVKRLLCGKIALRCPKADDGPSCRQLRASGPGTKIGVVNLDFTGKVPGSSIAISTLRCKRS